MIDDQLEAGVALGDGAKLGFPDRCMQHSFHPVLLRIGQYQSQVPSIIQLRSWGR